MSRHRRTAIAIEAALEHAQMLVTAGGKVRASRQRRRLTQRQLAARCDVSQSTISLAERGKGSTLSLDTWQRIATALELALSLDFGKDPLDETKDTGHLAMQELVIRLGHTAGYTSSFELPTKPSDPIRSTDVGLRDDKRRRLIQVECWNRPDDFSGGMRSSDRKRAEAEAFAVSRDGRPYAVFFVLGDALDRP